MENRNPDAITEISEPTPEETGGALRAYEDDILGGLLAAADFRQDEDEIHPIEIVRSGRVVLTFRVRPLSEGEYNRCKERYTKYTRHKQLGIRLPEKTDTIAYRSAIIYEATVEEDRKNIWDNKEAWKKLDVINGVELIGRVLKAGEKDAVCDLIDQISGYSITEEELAKN